MQYSIETSSLTKSFGEKAGVDGVDLHVPRGKIYALLGRNGAGKTTTIRMLLGLVRPTSGRIFLFGSDCKKQPEITYRKIG